MPYIQRFECVVYFLWSHDTHLIKIGMTSNLHERFRQIEKQLNQWVEPLGVLLGNINEEKEIHEKFDHLRVTGEWFRPEPKLMEYIWTNTEPVRWRDRTYFVPVPLVEHVRLQPYQRIIRVSMAPYRPKRPVQQ